MKATGIVTHRLAPSITATSPTTPNGSADGFELKMTSITALAVTTATCSLLTFEINGFEATLCSVGRGVSAPEDLSDTHDATGSPTLEAT
jgi:hypothetical protein